MPGATPGKWIRIWRERYPQTDLVLEHVSVAAQRHALIAPANTASTDTATTPAVDIALVREPIDTTGLHLIPLYDELPVVVMPADSSLTVADELTTDDLADEVVIIPADDVTGIRVPNAQNPAFAAPLDTESAIATVAAGIGVVIVPMSLARLHQRKDVTYRTLVDGPELPVALAWRREDDNPAIAAFIGVVRGRTERSTRS